MDVLFSKKAALKRRTSLSLLFGSQKPTFATQDKKPSRYYDFVDTPSSSKRDSPFISRQQISAEEESKIRYACSLLAYRIEQGVPAPSNNYDNRRPSRTGITGIRRQNTAEPQFASKYPTSKAGPEATGYDSGVGLTQQPSMQTMRVLNSRSGEPSDPGDTRTISIFSNTRTGTSCSNTTELSCTQSSTHSPKQDEVQSIAGAAIAECPQQNHSTTAFLTESLPDPPPYRESVNPEDTKVFLNPTITNLSADTLTSHPSPSLGLSRFPGLNGQSTSMANSPQVGCQTTYLQNGSIIVDSNGRTRLLSPDEESQRNKALQQAVLAKMRPGFMNYTPAREISTQQVRQQDLSSKPCSIHRELESKPKLPRSTSKFGSFWSRKKEQNGATQKLRDAVPLVGKLGRLFSREQST